MKMIIVVACALVAVAASIPVDEKHVEIVKHSIINKDDGGYLLEVETSDGTKRKEEAKLIEVLDEDNKPHKVLVTRGYYSYVDDAGNVEKIKYRADESGYHADGPSVPKDTAAVDENAAVRT